jgi:hypothetical protein
MATTNQHIVKATLIVVPLDGTERYLEKGAIVPDGVAAKDIKRLIETGLIAKVPAEEQTSTTSGGSGTDTNPPPTDPKK